MFIENQLPNSKAPEGRHVCRVGRMHHKSRKTIPCTAILIDNLNKFGHFLQLSAGMETLPTAY